MAIETIAEILACYTLQSYASGDLKLQGKSGISAFEKAPILNRISEHALTQSRSRSESALVVLCRVLTLIEKAASLLRALS